MQEIKFRAWDTDKKEMIPAYLIAGQPWNVFASIFNKTGMWKYMQFTGLLDSKGKEMYENDVVFDEDGEYSKTVIIEWDNENASFFGRDIFTNDSFSMQEIDGEIIGNVFENPDLSTSK